MRSQPWIALGLLTAWALPATAQVYAPAFPSPLFNTFGTTYPLNGFATYFPPVGFGAVNFGAVDFGAVNFGAVNFPAVNFYPVAGFGYDYAPFGAYPGALAGYGLAEPTYDLSSMEASTAATASGMIGARSLRSLLADQPEAARAGALPRFPLRSARAGAAATGPRLVDLTTRDGRVIWPEAAPTAGDLAEKRQAADDAIRLALSNFRATGRASVATITSAIRSLVNYANPAIEQLRRDDPASVFAFRDFVLSLDRGLRTLAGPTPIDAPQLDPVRARNR
ncbi:MAG: hypothetical protein KatS3mg108_2863 [Isosphaeraceae bacterium]|jgi:hypothetical protein|nr:MAG: hypothetical protein KatS3mg108_2863 [Isosphaeraceae bacterium]